MSETPRAIGRFAIFVSLILLGSSLGGCMTRSVRTPVLNRIGVQTHLVREVNGFTTRSRGYEQPMIISTERLIHILNAVEVETRGKGVGTVRQPAFHPDIVERTAQAFSETLAKAGPDEDVAVQVVRKESQLGIFNKKYLTSFLAYVRDGYLYLLLKRVDWLIPQTDLDGSLPKPRRDYNPMDFRVVAGEHLYYAGPQTLEIDWHSPVFQLAYRLPGSSQGTKRRREILEQSAIPRDEQDEAIGGGTGVTLDSLSPAQLRALADLEEDRNQGRITEIDYQRARRQLLRQR